MLTAGLYNIQPESLKCQSPLATANSSSFRSCTNFNSSGVHSVRARKTGQRLLTASGGRTMLWLTFMVFLTSFRAFRFNTDTRERNRSHYSKTVSGWQESDVTIVVVTGVWKSSSQKKLDPHDAPKTAIKLSKNSVKTRHVSLFLVTSWLVIQCRNWSV